MGAMQNWTQKQDKGKQECRSRETKPKPVQKKDPKWLQTHLGNPFLCFQANGLSVAEENKRIWCKSHYFFQYHFLPPPPWITPPKKKPPNTFSRSQKSIPKTQKEWLQIVIREFPRQCREEAFFKSLDFKLLDFEPVRMGAGLMGWCRRSVEHLCVCIYLYNISRRISWDPPKKRGEWLCFVPGFFWNLWISKPPVTGDPMILRDVYALSRFLIL